MKKKLILMTLAIAGLCFTSQAQKGQNRKAKNENRVNKIDSIAKVYGLTETQKTAFINANKNKRKSMKALKEEKLTDKKVIRERRKAIEATFDTEVKTIFTTEQYQKYTLEKTTRKNAKTESRKEGKVNRKADSMKVKYNLNADQHTKLKSAFAASSNKRAAIVTKYKDSDNNEAKKEEMKAERKSLDAQIQTILSEDQYKRWKADMKARKKGKRPKKK